jgi:DNA-nicking Smr family endonuclease
MTKPKKNKDLTKNDLPVLNSDDDFLNAFEPKDKSRSGAQKNIILENFATEDDYQDEADYSDNENFATMLEESFKIKKNRTIKKQTPLPLKKRLKRYPGVERELDLHGYNALGAQLKLRSFIQSCKHQGFFTLRIIVGKGIHSENGAVLPDVVEDELKEMKKQNLVIFYKWDRRTKAKSGAIIVYLKQFEQYD